MNVLVLDTVPGAKQLERSDVSVVRWLDIRHDRSITFVDHERVRMTSRWQCEERKRPFLVRNRSFETLAASRTLEGAIAAARKLLPKPTGNGH